MNALFLVLSLVVLTQSLAVLGYDICLPVFKGEKYSNNGTLKGYDDMGMLLIQHDQIFKSPTKKDNVNQVEQEGDDCSDRHHLCWHWALGCECSKNPGFMHSYCPLSCGICGVCQDTVTWCDEVVRTNYRYCYTQPLFALNMCRKTCHMCAGDCYNHHVKCQEWKREGACEKNPHYMYRYCMKSCGSCNKAESN